MHLVIFDIDGTLIHSHKKEVDCYEQALKKVTGISGITEDLNDYEHVSDHGIANESIYRAFQRAATQKEQAAIEETFIQLFEQTLSHTPPTTIPGVQGLFDQLNQKSDVALAIATGCYLRSASLKFTHANLPLHHLPIGSSNDSAIRTDIMQAAHKRAKEYYNIKEFDSITYIGDGPWDIRAVQTLKWNFIAIASNYSEDQLKQLGAKYIVKDYICTHSFFDHLHNQYLE